MIKKKNFTFSPKSSDSSDSDDYAPNNNDLNDRVYKEFQKQEPSMNEDLISDSPIKYLNIDQSDQKNY